MWRFLCYLHLYINFYQTLNVAQLLNYRLWWENDGVFTADQRKSLRDTSLARIICDNTGITDVPERPFQYRPRGSGYTKCSDIPSFDLSPWREDGELMS